MSNTIGERFRVTTWGESHGPAVGAVVDGCPAGLPIHVDELRAELARDVPDPGIGTGRSEPNEPVVLSGIYEGRTLGTPILVLVKNEDVCSKEYLDRGEVPRPGHADLTWRQRYGHVDPRGGGRASGRECIARLAAGAIAKKLIATAGVTVRSEVLELAGIAIRTEEDRERARAEVMRIGAEGDSSGGMVRITAEGLTAGIGEPVFGKLGARLGAALLSIGGVKSFEVGDGPEHARLRGSEANDAIVPSEGGARPATNRSGGLLGGISTGRPISLTLAVKPTPTIRRAQESVDLETGRATAVSGLGRFDLNFAPRVAVVGEAMCAIVLADALLGSGLIPPVRLGGDAG